MWIDYLRGIFQLPFPKRVWTDYSVLRSGLWERARRLRSGLWERARRLRSLGRRLRLRARRLRSTHSPLGCRASNGIPRLALEWIRQCGQYGRIRPRAAKLSGAPFVLFSLLVGLSGPRHTGHVGFVSSQVSICLEQNFSLHPLTL